MMPRNLYNRVELLAPVNDPVLQDELADVLDRAFAENAGAWTLRTDGDWRRRQVEGERRDMQAELIERHTELAKRPITAAASRG
jgi:polyphosphate kinase